MKVNLPANQSNPLGLEGRHFRIFTAEYPVQVEISTASGQVYFSGELESGVGLDFSDRQDFPEPFSRVRMLSAQAQVIDLWASLVKADDDRLSGSFNINAALAVAQTAPKLHNVPAMQTFSALTEVLPFRATRKAALIQTSAPVFVGSADGVQLNGLFSWDNQSALVLVPVSGSVTIRINEDYD